MIVGIVIAAIVIWIALSRCESKESRKRHNRRAGLGILGGVLLMLDAFINADKHQRY